MTWAKDRRLVNNPPAHAQGAGVIGVAQENGGLSTIKWPQPAGNNLWACTAGEHATRRLFPFDPGVSARVALLALAMLPRGDRVGRGLAPVRPGHLRQETSRRCWSLRRLGVGSTALTPARAGRARAPWQSAL